MDPARWHEAAAGLIHLSRGCRMQLQPISEELWRATVSSKPAQTCTGLDGLSRADMAAMPSALL